MITTAVILSFQMVGIYLVLQQGMILGWFRVFAANILDKSFGLKASIYIQKPLWECLPCMAGLWTIVLTLSFDIRLILLVCGINYIMQKILE